MTSDLIIDDRIGDSAVSGIVREHAKRLRDAGIEKLEIAPHQTYDGPGRPPIPGIELYPSKRNGAWTGDPTPAEKAIDDLTNDLRNRLGIPATKGGFRCDCPGGIVVPGYRPAPGV